MQHDFYEVSSMGLLTEIMAMIAVVIGTLFSVIGVVGYMRLPDVFTRLHATGKVGVFGVVLLLIAAVMVLPDLGWARGVILIVLLMVAGPAASHAIGSAAYRIGLQMERPVRDDLAGQRVQVENLDMVDQV